MDLVFDDVILDGRPHRIDPPLRLRASCESHIDVLLWVVEDSSLNITAYAQDRGRLRDEVLATLNMLWCEYALEDPSLLTDDARRLQSTLLGRIKETPNV